LPEAANDHQRAVWRLGALLSRVIFEHSGAATVSSGQKQRLRPALF
jgi:hypothetical protein